MAKRSPSRQRRAERRARERQRQKLERIERRAAERATEKQLLENQKLANSLDSTKWLGFIQDPFGHNHYLPRVTPEPGSLWRCDLYDARYMVHEVSDNGDIVNGQIWWSNKEVDTLLERIRSSRIVRLKVESRGFTMKDFMDAIEVDVRRMRNSTRKTAMFKTSCLDFCGIPEFLEHTIDNIVTPMAKGMAPETNRYHFRPIS